MEKSLAEELEPLSIKPLESATPSNKQEGTGIPVVICISLFVAIITSFTSVYSYDRWYAQKLVAVDIKGYIAQQRENYIAGKMNDEELKRSFDRLESVVIAIPKNKVVIMGDAVVRNIETIKP